MGIIKIGAAVDNAPLPPLRSKTVFFEVWCSWNFLSGQNFIAITTDKIFAKYQTLPRDY
jgi:hypothetical protein